MASVKVRPPNLRWRERGLQVHLTPHWGHSVAAAGIFAVNVAVLLLFVLDPVPGKPVPPFLKIVIALWEIFLVAWLFYPVWGRSRISFENGIFRAGKKLGLTLGELHGFTTEPTEHGVAVFAVKRDGKRIALDLPFANPLESEQGRSPAAEQKRREHGREEAEYVAERLDEMLAEARGQSTTYRG